MHSVTGVLQSGTQEVQQHAAIHHALALRQIFPFDPVYAVFGIIHGDETFYLDKAIAKNAKLSRYNISYSSDPQGYLYYENCFTIIRGENRITTTIWMHIEGEHPSEQDEDFAREMRYILNFLPFMADG